MDRQPGGVLVVDDEASNRTILRHFLESRGIDVADAPDGAQALARLRERQFDLILLDVVMPVLNGLEVLQEIRRSPIHGDVPVIMVTARDQSSDIVRAFGLGATDYVPRPIDFPVLLARVETQLALRRRGAALREANDRLAGDLAAARRVQEALLPPERPEVPGITVRWRFEPCEALAGDLLNVVPIDDRHVALYVLDVVGHGVAAALLAVMVNQALARMIAWGSDGNGPLSPAAVASRLNTEFPWNDRTQQFSTLLYGVLELKSREFRFVSAGHPGPIHLPRDGAVRAVKVEGHMIGLGDGKYEEQVLTLAPGDRLYLYSDGLTDQKNAAGKRFGKEHVGWVLADQRGAGLAEGLGKLLDAVKAWRAPATLDDDVSVLAVELR